MDLESHQVTMYSLHVPVVYPKSQVTLGPRSVVDLEGQSNESGVPPSHNVFFADILIAPLEILLCLYELPQSQV